MVGTGNIPMGGMITATAHYLDVDYSRLAPARGGHLLDLECLETFGFIDSRVPPLMWQVSIVNYMKLPRSHSISCGRHNTDLFIDLEPRCAPAFAY